MGGAFKVASRRVRGSVSILRYRFHSKGIQGAITKMTTPIFDSPAWPLKVPAKGCIYNPNVLINIEVSGRGGTVIRTVEVVIPPDLYTFATQILKVDNVNTLGYYLEPEGSRWYFGIMTEEHDYDLWYYTKSTMPNWAGGL